MANRPRALTLGAGLVSGVLAALVLGTALALALRADRFSLRPAEWAALGFTLKQAALSALLSGLLAIPTARALHRRRFPGRGAMVALIGAPFLLPTVVAVIGMLAVYGRNGIANQTLALLHLPPFPIFGLQGVVLCNLFFNLPLATRMLLNGWQAIPAERFRLAETLRLPAASQFRHLEIPLLRAVLPGACATVFLLCLGSFVIALTFGGGPKATTLELAIYQALRFDFDLGRAALLAALQASICAIAVVLTYRLTQPTALGAGLDRPILMAAPQGVRRWTDATTLSLAALFLALPMALIIRDGLPALTSLPAAIWAAALRSVLMALTSAGIASASALTLALATASASPAARWFELSAMLPMAVSGLVLGTGLFLILRPVLPPETLALPVTVFVNAAMALPFVYRLILPEAHDLHCNYDRLATTLNLPGITRLRRVTLPRLARPLGLGTGIAAALSMGDLGVIALFAGDQNATLPLLIQRLAGAYRMDQAAAASLLLVTLSFALFAAFDTGGRHAAP